MGPVYSELQDNREGKNIPPNPKTSSETGVWKGGPKVSCPQLSYQPGDQALSADPGLSHCAPGQIS